MTRDSDVLASLSALPAPDVDPWTARRIRRRALRALAKEQERARHPWLGALGRGYDRAEPLLAAAACVAYLSWAFDAAFSLLR